MVVKTGRCSSLDRRRLVDLIHLNQRIDLMHLNQRRNQYCFAHHLAMKTLLFGQIAWIRLVLPII